MQRSIVSPMRPRFQQALLILALLLPAPISSLFPTLSSEPATAAGQSLNAAPEPKRYRRSEHRYRYDDYELIDQQGKKTSLHKALGNEQGIMLNFVFTSCTTLCPLMSASFAHIQKKLGSEHRGLRLISVSIDPDHDTPQRLADYWQRFGAGLQWRLLTGAREDVIAVQKAFGVFLGNKSNHQSVVFLKGSPTGPWIRLDGYPSTADILAEYETLKNK